MKAISPEIAPAVSTQASSKQQKSVSEQENTTQPFSSVLQQTAQQRGLVSASQQETRASQVASSGKSYQAGSSSQSTSWLAK